jgi:hypothetical protein
MKIKHTVPIISIGIAVVVSALVFGFDVQAKDFARPNSELLSPSVSSENLPPGTYSTTITAADLQGFPPEIIAILVGVWETEFTAGGSYIVTKDGDIVVIGHYNSTSDTLIMHDLQGAYSCTDEPGIATGVYRWTVENNALVLSAVKDRCAGRQAILTAHAMQAQ